MQLLADVLLPALVTQADREGRRRLRLWSCGCASGEEAWSLAMLCADLPWARWGGRAAWTVDIIGTDIRPEAIDAARTGRYGDWSLRGCTTAVRTRWFAIDGDGWRVVDALRDGVRFECADLLNDPLPDPARGLADCDLVLCRNLFIYLQPQAVNQAARRLAASVRDGGVLMTGHGELPAQGVDGLQLEVHPGSLVHRKPAHRPAGGGLQDVARMLADGRVQEAHVHCQALLHADPMTAEAHLWAGHVARRLGHAAQARRAFRRALYLDPSLAAAREALAAGPAAAAASRKRGHP